MQFFVFLFVCLVLLVCLFVFPCAVMFCIEPVKAKINHRIAEIYFPYGPSIDHLQCWLECVFIGNHSNERRRSNTGNKENDCPCFWLTDSEAWFYLVCDGNSTAKAHLVWSTGVRKSLSLYPLSNLNHEACAVSFHFLSISIFPDACTDEPCHHQTQLHFSAGRKNIAA